MEGLRPQLATTRRPIRQPKRNLRDSVRLGAAAGMKRPRNPNRSACTMGGRRAFEKLASDGEICLEVPAQLHADAPKADEVEEALDEAMENQQGAEDVARASAHWVTVSRMKILIAVVIVIVVIGVVLTMVTATETLPSSMDPSPASVLAPEMPPLTPTVSPLHPPAGTLPSVEPPSQPTPANPQISASIPTPIELSSLPQPPSTPPPAPRSWSLLHPMPPACSPS